jgi:hypothetical protein
LLADFTDNHWSPGLKSGSPAPAVPSGVPYNYDSNVAPTLGTRFTF